MTMPFTADSLEPSAMPASSAALVDLNDMDFSAVRRAVQEQQERDLPPPSRAVLKRIPEVMDDFVRNFLLRNGMHRTLECFEVEWYDRYGSGANHHTPLVPDNYLETTALLNRIEALEHDLRQHAELTTKATRQWTQAKKDRDFHRANHNRVVQEKNRLKKQLQQANNHAEDINPTLVELRQRCEALFKAKAMLTLERDKLEQKNSMLEQRVDELQQRQEEHGTANNANERGGTGEKGKRKSGTAAGRSGSTAGRRGGVAVLPADGFSWPLDERPHKSVEPRSSVPIDPASWTNQNTFVAHTMTITKLALHPRKPAVATASDDGTWRLSTVPQGELIISGEGHTNWVSAVGMHPRGTMIATGSGDKTVKLWDFASNTCVNTLTGHTDGVWSVEFQDTGALLASGSLDHTARVWDVEHGKCRQALRGHIEAVNSVSWQPYTNILCTGSGDKTVSLWDCRMNCCAQTFYGHRTAVLSVCTVHSGDSIVSCDTEGVVMVWDARRMEQRMTVTCGPYPANHVSMDRTGSYIAVASDDTSIKIVDMKEEVVSELSGHEDAVQCVVFDPATNNFLVSCGSDRTVRYWS